MNASDRRNPRRLIRAIEIGLKLKGHNGEHEAATKAFSSEPLLIGLTAAYGILYQRVDRRIEEQAGQGAEKEIRTLLEQGYNWDLPAMTAMGYGVCQPYFEGRQTKEEVIRKWQFEEHAYIRRQMTWCKRAKRVSWFDITRKAWSKKVEELVRSWYNHP
jgi:tRNA dimethylallyltransferase